jgi:hypothetical protein
MQYRRLIYGTLVLILAKTETLHGRSLDILLLKGLSTNYLYLIKSLGYMGSFMPVQHFSSDSVLLQKEGLKKCDKESAYHFQINKYRSLLVAP